MATSKNPIHLCFITDEGYSLPTATAIASLKANKDAKSYCEIHVVCRRVSGERIGLLRSLAGDGVSIDVIEFDDLPLDEREINLVRHVSPTAILKFYLPCILPNENRVIYLDSDILVQKDLADLWRTDVSSVYAAVVKDNKTVADRDGHLKWLGFKRESYFNSGVMLLNLALMRRDGVTAKLIDYRIHGRNRFMDQDALNVVFGDRVKYASIRYNCLNWLFIACTTAQLREMFGSEDVAATPEETCRRAAVLHIGGSEKPWLCEMPYYGPLYRKYAESIGWNIQYPKVSVIVPVFNAAKHLRTALKSICSQSLTELDIMLVDNNSCDKSARVMEEFAARDGRIRIFKVEKRGAGVCRNFGIAHARGEYVGFVDSDDFIHRDYFKVLYDCATTEDADVCMTSSVHECDANGKAGKAKYMGVRGRGTVAGIRDRGDIVLASGATWNKIYRRRYLLDNNIHFSEQPCAGEDKLFDFGMLLTANRIAATDATTYYYRQSGSASESFRKKGRESFAIINFYRDIKKLIDESSISAADKNRWRDIAKRVRDAEFRSFSNRMDPRLRLEFSGCCVEAFYDDSSTVRRIPGLVVSLTTFPLRINTVHKTIKTLLGQSILPEKTILWLAREQFPNGKSSLPKQLVELCRHGLSIKWCNDIRSYKKLIPALKKYPRCTIVTADDDVLYPRYWLEKLWNAHLEFPDSIIFHRGRRITTRFSRISPYTKWPVLTRSIRQIRHHILPTGAGGVLYPPGALHKEVFNQLSFLSLAPFADDLWFWAMSVMNGTTTKQVFAYEGNLNIIEGSQTTSLSKINVDGRRNDTQLESILKTYPRIRVAMGNARRKHLHDNLHKTAAAFANAASAPFMYFKKNGVRNGLGRFIRSFSIKRMRGIVKQFVPYGLMCIWLERTYGTVIDMPLFFYPGLLKRIRRIVKFATPYGIEMLFRKHKYCE